MKLSLADKVSLSRIPLTILFILFIGNQFLSLIILTLVIISDILDGYLARKSKTTKFGATLDPLMDKFFIVTTFIFFLTNQEISFIQFLFLIIRDIYSISEMTLIQLLKSEKSHKANIFGKITTTLQFIAIGFLILRINLVNPLVIIILISSLITIISYIRSRWLK